MFTKIAGYGSLIFSVTWYYRMPVMVRGCSVAMSTPC